MTVKVVDNKTAIPLGNVAAIVSTVVVAALWVATISAKADALEGKVADLKQTASDVQEIKQRLVAMEYKIDFLVKVQGQPNK